MQKICFLVALAGVVGVSSAAVEYTNMTATATSHYAIGAPSAFGTRVVDPNAAYSNVTGFQGAGFRNGGTAGGITRMVMDDLTLAGGNVGKYVQTIRFSVANFNTTAVAARARIRFWQDNPASNTPGNYYSATTQTNPVAGPIGYTFNPISFGVGVTTFTFTTIGTGFQLNSGKIWAGITFDNVGTTTTAAQLDNLGQGLFNPVDVGSSADRAFQTTAAGSFFAPNNPVGTAINFGNDPLDPFSPAPANFGWEIVVPSPAGLAVLGMGGLMAARRRRA